MNKYNPCYVPKPPIENTAVEDLATVFTSGVISGWGDEGLPPAVGFSCEFLPMVNLGQQREMRLGITLARCRSRKAWVESNISICIPFCWIRRLPSRLQRPLRKENTSVVIVWKTVFIINILHKLQFFTESSRVMITYVLRVSPHRRKRSMMSTSLQ